MGGGIERVDPEGDEDHGTAYSTRMASVGSMRPTRRAGM